MSIAAPRDLKIGMIIAKTLGVLEINAAPALIFVVGLTVLNGLITYFAVGSLAPLRLLAGEALKMVVGIVFAYFLLAAMLRRTGLSSRSGDDTFLPYVGLSILYTLGVTLGVIAFVLPGLFFMARWSVAQPLLVARGQGIRASLGESWERTRGNEFSIIVAGLALVGLVIVVAIAASILFEPGDPIGIGISQLATSAGSAISLALGVALFGMIVGGEQEARAFE